jgi:hypothetical protein
MYRGYKCVHLELSRCDNSLSFGDWDGRDICKYRYLLELYTNQSIIIPEKYVGLLKPSVHLHKMSYLGFDLSRVDHLLAGEHVISYVFPIPNIVLGFGRIESGKDCSYKDIVYNRLKGLGFFEVVVLDLLVFPGLPVGV